MIYTPYNVPQSLKHNKISSGADFGVPSSPESGHMTCDGEQLTSLNFAQALPQCTQQHNAYATLEFLTLLPMTLVKCPGCRKKYENGSSLSAHQRNCAGLEAKAKELFKKRDKNRKQKKTAKIARQDYSQDNVLEIRADVREDINSLDAEETHSGKRKMGGQNLVTVSICIILNEMVFLSRKY
jgi:hypothetical protein